MFHESFDLSPTPDRDLACIAHPTKPTPTSPLDAHLAATAERNAARALLSAADEVLDLLDAYAAIGLVRMPAPLELALEAYRTRRELAQ